MFQFYAVVIVKSKYFIGEGLLPNDDLDSALSFEVDDLVENSVEACRLDELNFVDGSKVGEAVLVLQSAEEDLGGDFLLSRLLDDQVGQAGAPVVS